MIWLQIVYLLVLVYLVINKSKISNINLFRGAWIAFALIPISNAVFTVFRAGNIRSTRGLALVEVWSNGLAWLLFGISLLILINALIPAEEPKPFSLERSNDKETQAGPEA